MKHIVLFLLVSYTYCAAAQTPRYDITEKFHQLYNSPEFIDQEKLQKRLQQYEVLLVSGFLGDVTPEVITSYFSPQKDFLDKLRVKYYQVTTVSSLSEETNALLLQEKIQQSEKPLIILSHSRGGLCVLRTLINNYWLLPNKVVAWISIQTPFNGSPGADRFSESDLLRRFTGGRIGSVGADPAVVEEMTSATRKQFQNEFGKHIDKILATIPVISYGSTRQPLSKLEYGYYAHITRGPLFEYGTDGVVRPLDAVLRGHSIASHFIMQQDVDHRDPIMKSSFGIQSFKPENFNKSLFVLLLNKIAENEPLSQATVAAPKRERLK